MDLRRTSNALTQADKLALVSVAEVKAQVRELSSDEDEFIAEQIEHAYDFLAGPKGWLGRCALLNETYEWHVDGPEGTGFELPMRPLVTDQPITVEYLDSTAGTYSAVDTARYVLSPSETFASLARAPARLWPYVGMPHPRAYRITFTAGFGATRDDVPSPLRQGIKMLAAYWFRQRETVSSEGRAPGREIEYGLRAVCGRFYVPNNPG